MERDLNTDEFEIFLKQKADQHKLYPTDRPWKGIYNSLHPGMKWFKVGGSLLILSTLFVVYQETALFKPSAGSAAKKAIEITNTPLRVVSETSNSSLPHNTSNSTTSTLPYKTANDHIVAPATVHGEDESSATAEVAAKDVVITNAVSNADLQSGLISGRGTSLKGFDLNNLKLLALTSGGRVGIPSNNLRTAQTNDNPTETADHESGTTRAIVAAVVGAHLSAEEAVSVNDLNWLQEMAAIKLTPRKKSPFNLQFYFSPTVSYRRLADNQNVSHSSILNAPSVSRDLNINRYVDHNPAIGVELGSNILFSVNRNFVLKSGLQLNYSRYNIKAFRSSYEKTSIALSTAGRIADTLSSYTSIRNYSGYAAEELQNQYLQVSVPVGAELKLLGNKRLQFSVAGTIQPTFLLFSDTYLLSTNYLNYTKEPSLIRKWNVHSSFEAFLSYKTGGLRWQLGPQFRYQLMSSFNDRYPIKEYLMEYGVKIGVSKTLR